MMEGAPRTLQLTAVCTATSNKFPQQGGAPPSPRMCGRAGPAANTVTENAPAVTGALTGNCSARTDECSCFSSRESRRVVKNRMTFNLSEELHFFGPLCSHGGAAEPVEHFITPDTAQRANSHRTCMVWSLRTCKWLHSKNTSLKEYLCLQ